MTIYGDVLWSGSTRESVYAFQAQKSNVQFLAIAHEHASECKRVLNPDAHPHALFVVCEVVIPDVELFEIGHLKNSLIDLEDPIGQKTFLEVIVLPALPYKKYNNTNCYKKQLAIITTAVKIITKFQTDEGKDRHEQLRN